MYHSPKGQKATLLSLSQQLPTEMENVNIKELISEDVSVKVIDGINVAPVSPLNITFGLGANAEYFGHEAWGKLWLDALHRDQEFIDRWSAATGSWDNKIVVDIGCGPGNIYASLGGKPKLLIGVDISYGTLKIAQKLGYMPLLADAQDLPLRSGFADIVVINATLHHVDNMKAVLSEAARLVKPGGILVTDHDTQLSAMDFKGLGYQMWIIRYLIYRLIKRGGHASAYEQRCAIAAEVHQVCGDGVTKDLYYSVLEKQGFDVKIFPHNNTLGAEVLNGNMGRANFKYRLAQRLSGMNPADPSSALSLMCVARKSQQRQASLKQAV